MKYSINRYLSRSYSQDTLKPRPSRACRAPSSPNGVGGPAAPLVSYDMTCPKWLQNSKGSRVACSLSPRIRNHSPPNLDFYVIPPGHCDVAYNETVLSNRALALPKPGSIAELASPSAKLASPLDTHPRSVCLRRFPHRRTTSQTLDYRTFAGVTSDQYRRICLWQRLPLRSS